MKESAWDSYNSEVYAKNNKTLAISFDLRHYPKKFGSALASLIRGEPIPIDLRNKREVATAKTDREIFEEMTLDDVWWDAELPQLYWYLKEHLTFTIPPSWESTIQHFEKDLLKDSWLTLNLVHLHVQ